MTSPTYSVLAADPRFRAIVAGAGGLIPTPDGHALLREWDRAGYRHICFRLARLVGASVAVLRNPGDALDLARELGHDPDAGE